MSAESRLITPEQCRMARGALKIGLRELARMASVAPNTVARLERGDPTQPSTLKVVRLTLEAAGIEFIDENGGGAGVRLRR